RQGRTVAAADRGDQGSRQGRAPGEGQQSAELDRQQAAQIRIELLVRITLLRNITNRSSSEANSLRKSNRISAAWLRTFVAISHTNEQRRAQRTGVVQCP